MIVGTESIVAATSANSAASAGYEDQTTTVQGYHYVSWTLLLTLRKTEKYKIHIH